MSGRRILCGHFRPIAFQFFGQELREAGACALPHLGSCDADDASVVGFDDNPGRDFRITGRDSGEAPGADIARAECRQAQREAAAAMAAEPMTKWRRDVFTMSALKDLRRVFMIRSCARADDVTS